MIYLRKIHPTWHFTIWCGGIVAGLWLSVQSWALLFADWSWIIFGGLLLVITVYKQWRWLLLLSVIGGMLVGLSRGASQHAELTVFDVLYGRELTVSGVVAEDVDTDKTGNTTLRLKNLMVEDYAIDGELWVSLAGAQKSVRRSDNITVNGTIQEGFGSFGGVIYRAELKSAERPVPGDVALDVRDRFGDEVREYIKEPSASLGMGYLAGQRRSLPTELDQSLKIAGLTHVVVASGYNLTILVRFARRFFAKYSRFLTVFISSMLIIAFIGVTGLSPSMTRAGLVAGLALLAWYFGRKFHPVTLIVFAAAATGLISPSYVWGNLGWQLSFLSFAGVMILAPLLQAYFFGDKKPGAIRQVIGETLSAQLMTAPLILFAFGTLSTVALGANVLVLPLVPLAMLLVFLTGLFGFIMPLLAMVIGLPTQWLLDYMVAVATKLSSFEWSQIEIAISPAMVAGLYMAIIGVILYFKWRTGYNLRDSNIVE